MVESQVSEENEARKRKGVERVYQNEHITVFWEPKLCIHAGDCIRGLPKVFRPQSRPWVHLDAAEAGQIAEVIKTCPTGALHFELPGEDEADTQPAPVTILVRQNGPLYIRGPVRIVQRDGSILREDTRLALCRCGHSKNKPFCDGSHDWVGFDTSSQAR